MQLACTIKYNNLKITQTIRKQQVSKHISSVVYNDTKHYHPELAAM